MSQTFDRNFYDDKTITSTYPLTHPRIGYENLSTSVTASSSLAGFPASSMLTPLTYELWKTSTFPATITFDLNGANAVDYVGIAAHTLAGFTVEVKTSTDDVTYTQRSIADIQDNGAIMLVFNEVTVNYVQLVITGTGTASIGVFYTGKCLEMQRAIYGGVSPGRLSRKTTTVPNMSEGGQWLGRSVIRQGEITNFDFVNLKADWYRDNFESFVEAAVSNPFFVAWRPERFANEVVFGQTTDDISPSNQGVIDFMSVSFSVMGYRPLGPLVTRVEPVPLAASLSLDFINGAYAQSGTASTLDALTTYTRASDASTINKYNAGAGDFYEIDYFNDGSTTNYLLHSQELTNSAWTKNPAVSITADATTAPDGTTTADRMTTNNGIFGGANVFQDAMLPSATTHSFSFYAKADTHDIVQLSFSNSHVAYDAYANINLTTGEMAEFSSGTTTPNFGFIGRKYAGNGWWRVYCVPIISNTDFGCAVGIVPAMNSNRQHAQTWDGTDSVYLWGLQAGSTGRIFGYVPTTATTASGTFNGSPRFDYDTQTGVLKGLLVESQATNLLVRSQEFERSEWVKSACGAYPQKAGVLSPDGSYETTEHTIAGPVSVMYQDGITVTSGAEYTVSIYAKKGYTDFYQICFGTGDVTSNPRANFDLNTGVLGSVSGGITATIEPFTDGWYRIAVTFTPIVASLRVQFAMIDDANTDRLEAITWGATGSGNYIWGAQLEAGGRVTSYIRSFGGAGTRNADRLHVAVSDAGTFTDISTVFTVTPNGVGSSDNYIYDIATTAQSIDVRQNSSGDILARKGSVDATVAASSDYTLNAQFTGVTTFDQSGGTIRTYLDGVEKSILAAGTAAPIDNTGNIQIGDSLAGAECFEGHIGKVEFYNIVLTDQQISEL